MATSGRLTQTQINYLYDRFEIIVRRVGERFDKLNPPKKMLTDQEKVALIYNKKATLDIDQFTDGCPYGNFLGRFIFKGEDDKKAYNEALSGCRTKIIDRINEKRQGFVDKFVMREWTDSKAIAAFEKECLKEIKKLKPVTNKK